MFETLLVPIIIVLAVLYILSIIIIPNMLDSFADTHYLELNQNERGDYMFELKPIKELPVEEELCQPIEYPVYRVFSRPLRVINISRISPIKIEEVSRGIKDLKAVLEKKMNASTSYCSGIFSLTHRTKKSGTTITYCILQTLTTMNPRTASHGLCFFRYY